MIEYNSLEVHEQDAFLDTFYERYGYFPDSTVAQNMISNLPDFIIQEASQWGFNDTVVGDMILKYWKDKI